MNNDITGNTVNPSLCFCGSRSPLKSCCEPLLSNKEQAKTAEQLMRSRFSAFCSGNIDYLINSHHPSKRQPDDRQQLTHTIDQCQWLNLVIKQTIQGLENDREGQVEYIATYQQHGQLSQLHENSRFVKEDGQWFYLDGTFLSGKANSNPDALKPGRNDPCWCGSGNKFKKCHG